VDIILLLYAMYRVVVYGRPMLLYILDLLLFISIQLLEL